MNTDEQLNQVELSIEHAQKTIGLMNSVLKLSDNADFKAVIEVGYFEKEASRLVLLKADPNMQGENDQKMINNAINAIGYFRQYLGTTIQLGRMAENAVKADQETREELLSEGL